MLTVVRAQDANGAGEAAAKGADVVIVEKADAGKLKQAAEKAGSATMGAVLEKAARSDVASLVEAGIDFVVLEPASALAEALLDEKAGVVLRVEPSAEDTELRVLGDLSVDALLVRPPESPLTLQAALRLRRIAGLARTPLLAPVDPAVDVSTLQALRDAGVVGVVIETSALSKLDGLKETILKLRPRGRRREDHTDATLPAGVAAGDDDDDWDDD